METRMNTAVKKLIGSMSVGLGLSVVGLVAQTTTPPTTTPAAPVLPTYTVSTVAGSYNMTDTSNFSPVINPLAIAVDGSGNVFFTDTFGNRVRRIDAATGAIT